MRSLDTTYQDLGSVVSGSGATYVMNSSREPSTKPSHIQMNIVQGAAAGSGGQIISKGNQGRQRILQPGVSNNSAAPPNAGSLTSRFPQGHHPEAGVFSYHD